MPTSQATLVDLLDRVLDRGLVIRADVIIALAGVPLIGITLTAALAGMETMVKHGLMEDWDQRVRASAMPRAQQARSLATLWADRPLQATIDSVAQVKDGQGHRD